MAAHVYIMASQRNGTLYVGVTTDLAQRAYQHREGLIPGFTEKHSCKLLVWYEEFFDVSDAIYREKIVKKYYRRWKLKLIEDLNPEWKDLYLTLNI
jgi:putative endonuclease